VRSNELDLVGIGEALHLGNEDARFAIVVLVSACAPGRARLGRRSRHDERALGIVEPFRPTRNRSTRPEASPIAAHALARQDPASRDAREEVFAVAHVERENAARQNPSAIRS